MGIDNVHQRYISDAVQVNSAPKSAQEQEVQPVITGSATPAGDSVQIQKPIPEWANIEKSDGKIGDFSQGSTGDCWLLATLISIKNAGKEDTFISPRIKKADGKLTVTFGTGSTKRSFSFSQQDINDRITKLPEEVTEYTVAEGGEQLRDIIKKHNSNRLTPESIRRLINLNNLTDADVPKAAGGRVLQVPHIFGKLSSGDVDVMALEMALEKSISKEIKGDYPSTAAQTILGRPVTSVHLANGNAKTGHENAAVDESKSSWGLLHYALKRKNNVAIIAATKDKLPNNNSGLFAHHAYSIDLSRSNEERIVLINSHTYGETENGVRKGEKTVTWQEFKDNFSYASIADLSKYNTYIVKSGDNLSKIASKKSVKPQDLMLANPTIKDINKIKPGDVLNIPVLSN